MHSSISVNVQKHNNFLSICCVYFSRDVFLFKWRNKTDMKVVENNSERFRGGHIRVLKHTPVVAGCSTGRYRI